MTQPFLHQPDLRHYSIRDLGRASTPQELHTVSYALLAQRMAPAHMEAGSGLFLGYPSDTLTSDVPLKVRQFLATGAPFFRVEHAFGHKLTLDRPLSLWALSGMQFKVFQRFFRGVQDPFVWVPFEHLFRPESARRVSTSLGIILDDPHGGFELEAYGMNAIEGIRNEARPRLPMYQAGGRVPGISEDDHPFREIGATDPHKDVMTFFTRIKLPPLDAPNSNFV